jgi:S1-C subfamily serine protease
MTRFRLPVAILALAAAVAVGAGFATSKTQSSKTQSSGSASVGVALQNAFVSVYRNVSPSVVQIQTSEGLGSGIVFDSKGDIVTNDHVVGTSTSFTVTTSTGKQLTGKLVGTFAPDDLAVIRVPATGLKPAVFANSDDVRVGDLAMAIGNPLGLSSSVTEGIVSGINRQEPEGGNVVLQSAIQTSAAINPGNSGGALVNISGQVIGIPTLAATDPQLGGAAAGIGFAIPSSVIKSIAGQLVASGKVTNSGRAYLGVESADTGEGNGAYIGQVLSGTGAAKAGLVAGDLITAINSMPVTDSSDLSTALAGFKPGQTVTVKLVRQDGAKASVQVTLGQLPGGG